MRYSPQLMIQNEHSASRILGLVAPYYVLTAALADSLSKRSGAA